METVCQANFNLMKSSEMRKAEAILRDYLLRSSDEVSLNLKSSSPYSLFNILPDSMRGRKLVRVLQEEDLAEKGKEHWTLKMTENVKNLLNQETLMFNGKRRFFSDFTDPKFKKNGNELAAYNTSEKILNLYIPDDDKAEITKLGVYLDSPEI